MPALGHVLMLVQNVYRCKRCGYEQQPVVIGPIQPPVDPPISTASVEQEDVTAMSAEREEVTTLRVLASTVTEHHDYVYASGKLLREVITRTDADGNVTTEVLDFTYDASGNPYALTYTNGTETPVTYYYVVNLQGDVIRLVSTNGASVAQYWYGPYGEVRQAFGAMAEANPLRYRGYYYDADTEFYYLQSRYYDPAICRFINADGLASTGQGFIGCNMFTYCLNNPVIFGDDQGRDAYLLIDNEGAHEFGHMGFIVQDEEGNWWHFYWGPETAVYGVLSISGFSVPHQTWCIRIELEEDVTLKDINGAEQYDGDYDAMVHLSGDFSDVLKYAKDQNSNYNLYGENCAQVSLTLLMKANTRYNPILESGKSRLLPIPNLMFSDIQDFFMLTRIPITGPGGGGRDTCSVFN